MRTTLISLDIGSVTIKAAQWQHAAGLGGRWNLRTAAWPRQTQGTLGPEEASRIAAVLARRGFVGRDVAVLAPGEMAHVQEIDMPAGVVGAGRGAVARMELARVCRIDPSAFEFETWDLPRVGRPGESAVGAAVLAHSDADQLVLPLQEAGLVAVTIGSAARAFGELLGRTGTTIDTVADLGASALSLTVLVGGACVYERRLAELGTRALVASIGETLKLTEAQAEQALATAARLPEGAMASALGGLLRQHGSRIGEEISVSLEYASHRYPKAAEGRMLAVGGGACHASIVKAAGQALGCDVQTPSVPVPLIDAVIAPPWCVVAAAAMLVAPSARATGGAS